MTFRPPGRATSPTPRTRSLSPATAVRLVRTSEARLLCFFTTCCQCITVAINICFIVKIVIPHLFLRNLLPTLARTPSSSSISASHSSKTIMSTNHVKSSEDMNRYSPDCSDSNEMVDLKLTNEEKEQTSVTIETPTESKQTTTFSKLSKKWKFIAFFSITVVACLAVIGIYFLCHYFGKHSTVEEKSVSEGAEEITPSVDSQYDSNISKTSLNVNTAEPTIPKSILSISKDSIPY